ncbi:MAG: sulfite exporter TauE/SafE family protein [Chloroherpetonaceae bacterium]|nr:sulfite exporter TauE/SafE family protein [Chloroherpetonaceae bacterium]
MPFYFFILLGFGAGILSGLFGIGGGIVIVPALVFLFGFQQHNATATSLIALLLPVGLLAAYQYYSAGKLSSENIQHGLFIAGGLFFGAFLGSKIAISLPEETLRKAFAVLLVIVAVQLWLKK